MEVRGGLEEEGPLCGGLREGLSSVQSRLAWFAMVLCLKAESLGVHKPSGWKNLLRSASSPKHCAENNVCLSQQWSVKAWDSKTRLMLHGPEKPRPLELGRQWRTKQDGKREAARTAGCRRCGGLEQLKSKQGWRESVQKGMTR